MPVMHPYDKNVRFPPKMFAVSLFMYEHVYEVSSLYDIGKLHFQNPCFSRDSREISVAWHGHRGDPAAAPPASPARPRAARKGRKW